MSSKSKNLNVVAFTDMSGDDEHTLGFEDVERAAPPMNLRGGAGEDDDENETSDEFADGEETNPEATDDEGDAGDEGEGAEEEDDEPQVNENLVLGKKEDGEDEDKQQRRRKYLVLLALLALVALIVGLAAGLSGGDDFEPPAAKLNTSTPTLEPTPLPTPPTTPGPTRSPVAPTFSGTDPDRSAKTCEELTDPSDPIQEAGPGTPFGDDFIKVDGSLGCSDTYAGFDPTRPNRNHWTARVSRRDCDEHDYEGGKAVCESVGARRCSADELKKKAGQGTGCGGDNVLLYSGTECEVGGQPGRYLVNLEFKINATFFECETDLSRQSLTRCCADHE